MCFIMEKKTFTMKFHRPLFYIGAGLVVAGAIYSIIDNINYAVLGLWILGFFLVLSDYVKGRK